MARIYLLWMRVRKWLIVKLKLHLREYPREGIVMEVRYMDRRGRQGQCVYLKPGTHWMLEIATTDRADMGYRFGLAADHGS